MLSEFNDIIEKVLAHEGGYVDDPDDAGGETKYGISRKAYPNENIKDLTIERAKELYKRDYWDKYRAGDVSRAIRHNYFDMCVNMGGYRAIKILQEACNSYTGNKIRVDGLIGTITIRASSKLSNERLRAYRVLFYAKLVIKTPSNEKYWFGWFRRSCGI